MNINTLLLTKGQLVDLTRRIIGTVGDTGRNDKAHYVHALVPHQAAVDQLCQQLGYTAGKPRATGFKAVKRTKKTAVPTPVAEAATAPVVTHHAPIGKTMSTLGALFGVKGPLSAVPCAQFNDPEAPVPDPDYSFDPEKLALAAIAVENGLNVWCYGHASTGKTDFWKQFASHTGRAYFRVSFDGTSEKYDIIGGERPKAGNLVWQDGLVLQAYRRAGAICLLDEISFARPEYASALHAVTEPRSSYQISETGERVHRAADMAFAVADNANAGHGDTTGIYNGIRPQNAALLSRFPVKLEFTYLDPKAESRVIGKRSGCSKVIADSIVGFLTAARQGVAKGDIESAPVLREAFALAMLINSGVAPRNAFVCTMVAGAAPESREFLQQVWASNVKEADIIASLTGEQPEAIAA